MKRKFVIFLHTPMNCFNLFKSQNQRELLQFNYDELNVILNITIMLLYLICLYHNKLYLYSIRVQIIDVFE